VELGGLGDRRVYDLRISSDPTIPDLIRVGEDGLFEAGFRTGDFAEARERLSRAREGAKRDGDRALQAAAADRLGLALHYENIARLKQGAELTPADVDAEEMLFREALDSREAADDQAGVAQSSFGLGLVSQVLRGRLDVGDATVLASARDS
jgi:hypothetical protein